MLADLGAPLLSSFRTFPHEYFVTTFLFFYYSAPQTSFFHGVIDLGEEEKVIKQPKPLFFQKLWKGSAKDGEFG